MAKKKMERVCIVIPTYNESENIFPLLNSIFKHVGGENRKRSVRDKAEVHVLVVDDNSPDGTAKRVREYRKKNSRVHLLLRKNKEGLGAAYKAGMKHAIKTLRPSIIFEMDADFSHNPNDIFRMIDKIREGYDFVIGSRYIDGGSVPEDWGAHRKVLSYSARTVTRMLLGLEGIRDCSGGFRAIRREVLETVDLDNLVGDGYGFQASLLESAVHHGFDITEIPIQFDNRTKGTSKMTFNDVLEGWAIIFKIKSRRLMQQFNGKESYKETAR